MQKPELSPGAHSALNDALHRLHQLAKYPSLNSMAAALTAREVNDASRTTIYNAFSSSRLPMPGLVDAVVVELASRVRNVTPEQIDAACVGFDNLWFLADFEDRHRMGETARTGEDERVSANGRAEGDRLPVVRRGGQTVLVSRAGHESLVNSHGRLRELSELSRQHLSKMLKDPDYMSDLVSICLAAALGGLIR
ncbi:hypothetical protein ACIOGT_25775 [Streptomyces microflavus]|uniref:hypothetical protein n=1 Tax=Streptomyces microflavus TaxID=1919 RepID=UPI0037FC132C